MSFNSASGEVLYLSTFELESGENCATRGFMDRDFRDKQMCWYGFLPNILWEGTEYDASSSHSALMTDGVLKFVKKFNIDLVVLQQISSISVSIAPWD